MYRYSDGMTDVIAELSPGNCRKKKNCINNAIKRKCMYVSLKTSVECIQNVGQILMHHPVK